ncbi:MAG: Uma2 family endonuclease [Pseudomonadota bacterium]|nr:Uma2 family endonuclease [Gammaproteobacteria bacterium]MDQ3583484.1 Uma2 family endonuclease [Pseudomonadota bacterium]
MRSLAQPSCTPEEYLALERKATRKSEYVNGHVFAMAGASLEHNQITFNIAVELGVQLRGRPCAAYVSDLRVKVAATGLYTYPDVVALCGEAIFEDSAMDTLVNPQVIIEVLSASTEAYDRGEKFAHYRRFPTLTDYVLIAQDKVPVEHYVRQDRQWVLSEADEWNDTIHLSSIDCRLALRDIYDKVEFSDTDSLETVPPADTPAANAPVPRGA